MTRESPVPFHRHRSVATIAFVLAAATGLACAKLEKEHPPQVVTAGPHAVTQGATITITATTQDGSDPGYTFTSADTSIASVDDQGVVTGLAVGETSISVTGSKTDAVGAHAIVVVAPSDTAQIPYYDKWLTSAHADATALPFNNWNSQGAVPVECARCHSSEGFVDYIGGDGSVPGQVDKPAPVKSVIRCETCHNPTADKLSSVTFPSGVTVDGLGG